MSEKLKPCPFCGQRPEIQSYQEAYHQVICGDNHTATIEIESFDEWNHRPIEDALQSEITRLTAENAELREANRWISVDERLPEETAFYQVVMYQIHNKKSYRTSARFDIITKTWNTEVHTITHWRENLPLPQLSEEE